jgi:predicted metal-dependent peptidase
MSQELKMDVKDLIYKAKLKLFMHPQWEKTLFFTNLLSLLEYKETRDIPTYAATDGKYLYIHPEKCKDLTIEQMMGLLMHEASHPALDHISRCSEAKLNKLLYNVAGDLRINADLLAMGFELPPGGLFDKKYADPKIWGTTEIYMDLLQNQEEEDAPGQGGKFDMDIIPVSGDDPNAQRELEDILIKACQQTEMIAPGSVPGNIKRMLEELLTPKVDWKVVLANKVQEKVKDDYNMRKNSRRTSYDEDLFCPSLENEKMGPVFIAFDASGSTVSNYEEFWTEVKEIQTLCNPSEMRVVAFDTKITEDVTFNDYDELEPVDLGGGGGTSFRPVVEIMKATDPEFAVVFTDGEFTMPDLAEVTDEIYWIVPEGTEFHPPSGTVIPMTENP